MPISGVHEPSLRQAERRVQVNEDYIARQLSTIQSLRRDGHQREADMAGRVLASLREKLALARDELLVEQWIHDLET